MENHSLHCSFPCFARPSGLSSIKHNIMQRKLKKIQSCITIQRAFRSVLFRNHINNMINLTNEVNMKDKYQKCSEDIKTVLKKSIDSTLKIGRLLNDHKIKDKDHLSVQV